MSPFFQGRSILQLYSTIRAGLASCSRRGTLMNTINFEDITIASGVRETASEDGAVLLDIQQGICFSLNPVGLRVWTMLKQQFSLDQMADSLQQEFHAPRLELVADICEFVR